MYVIITSERERERCNFNETIHLIAYYLYTYFYRLRTGYAGTAYVYRSDLNNTIRLFINQQKKNVHISQTTMNT